MATTAKLYTLSYTEYKTYLVATAFIIGNILFPQLAHLIPGGGLTWLPIYFFTLISAYKYGWKAGLLTALFSPLINSYLFGMPPVAALPAILIKSVLLAMIAGITASHYKKNTLPIIAAVVITYQFIGTAAEWILTGNLYTAIQDFRIGIPGIVLQIIGGYLFVKYIHLPTKEEE